MREVLKPLVMIGSHLSRPELRWIGAVRWVILGLELVLLLAAIWLARLPLPALPCLAVILVMALSNCALAVAARRGVSGEQNLFFGVLVLDIIGLTVLLWLSGGPMNPFTALYLIYIALAAVVLEGPSTWALVVVAAAAYGLLYLGSWAAPAGPTDHASQMRLHLQGMWIAFLVTALLIGFSVTRLQAMLAQEREARSRSHRLTALATLAAGAAHELATPLSTIAVIAKELERRILAEQLDPALAEDTQVLRQQVSRCRHVLDRLAAQIHQDEEGVGLTLGDVIAQAMGGLPQSGAIRVDVANALLFQTLPVPPEALVVSLRNVVQNALDASEKGQPVTIRAQETPRGLVLEVEDQGEGMPLEVLDRVGEPFFSTKGVGRGTGLGLFLAEGLLEPLGVTLELTSAPAEGTTVRFILPTLAITPSLRTSL